MNYIITDDDGDPPFSTTAGELDERFLPDFELIRRWTHARTKTGRARN